MAERATRKGLVLKLSNTIMFPVNVFKAFDKLQSKMTRNTMHATCRTRLQQPKWCPTCSTTVPADEVTKVFEVSDGVYVDFTDAEMEQIKTDASDLLDCTTLGYVPLATIDPAWFSGEIYTLKPEVPKGKTTSPLQPLVNLLVATLHETKLVGLARYATSDRETLVGLRAAGGNLLLQYLRDPQEMRIDLAAPLPDVKAEEVTAFSTLLTNLADEAFTPSDEPNRLYEAFLAAVAQKQANPAAVLTAPTATAPKPVADVMAAILSELASLPAADAKPKKGKKTVAA